jgi:branched-chain amino acid transport system ATP-binding protein
MTPLLEARGIVAQYGRIRVLHGVDIRVGAGELVAIVGANGAGKTTLLRILSGVLPLHAGHVAFEGRSLARVRSSQRVGLGIVQVPEGRQIFGAMTVDDNLRLGAFRRRGSPQDLQRIYDDLFPKLAEFRNTRASALSGGQQQMLAIGRALMADPRLLLLDEPSMGLAPIAVRQVYEMIGMLRGKGMTICLVEQNARAALAHADRAYVIESGTISLSGPAGEVARDDAVRRAYLAY